MKSIFFHNSLFLHRRNKYNDFRCFLFNLENMIRRHISNSLWPPFDPGRQSYSNTKYAAFTRQLHISKLLLCTNHNTQAGFILVSEKFVLGQQVLGQQIHSWEVTREWGKINALLKKKGKMKEKGEKKGKQTLFWYYFELQKRLMNRKTKQRLMYCMLLQLSMQSRVFFPCIKYFF